MMAPVDFFVKTIVNKTAKEAEATSIKTGIKLPYRSLFWQHKVIEKRKETEWPRPN
ncbi:hypothetical protein [Rahnella bruchi]|uniref:hypothetical protein n=1 Tax=Rahnella bruchi TaxID=1510573 RepID=UPI0013C43F1F|nr:hypothetical protein [Rahnella bruchi]